MNALDGVVDLSGETTFQFRFAPRTSLYGNSQDIGVGTYPYDLSSGNDYYGMSPLQGLAQVELATTNVFTIQPVDSLAPASLKISPTTATGEVTQVYATIWGVKEWTLRQSSIKTSLPTTVLTVNM